MHNGKPSRSIPEPREVSKPTNHTPRADVAGEVKKVTKGVTARILNQASKPLKKK